MRHPGLCLLLICLLISLQPQVSGFSQGRSGCPSVRTYRVCQLMKDECRYDSDCRDRKRCCNNGCNNSCMSSDLSWFGFMNPFSWSAYGPFQ